MFCRKCHKRVIETINTSNETKNTCMCQRFAFVVRGSEVTGVVNGANVRRKLQRKK